MQTACTRPRRGSATRLKEHHYYTAVNVVLWFTIQASLVDGRRDYIQATLLKAGKHSCSLFYLKVEIVSSSYSEEYEASRPLCHI